ncbi:DEKNAAC102711 [Brettanomyces naardenensis]|uniref:DEKNAAC102711 n=1 Tax=Brettanomyces naardenensis TaxID=13370 RepID=A0A448YL48_BRENA|nr:DEKNAAC102711 [Brettanomyces naardenensis]
MTTEVEFAEKYQDLISFICPEKIPGGKLEEVGKIPNFGFSKLDNPPLYLRGGGQQSTSKDITVTFRSIRPPRFNKKIEISSDSLIHKIKRILQESLKEDGIDVTVEQIVLLLKTKTTHDGAKLSSLLVNPDDTMLTFNVLISKSIPKQEAGEDVVAETTSTETLPRLSEKAWTKINDILKDEISDNDLREEYLKRLREVEERTG